MIATNLLVDVRANVTSAKTFYNVSITFEKMKIPLTSMVVFNPKLQIYGMMFAYLLVD